MTQYGVLGAWEAAQVGFHIPPREIDDVLDWLLKTQDPSGAYGWGGKFLKPIVLRAVAQLEHSPTANCRGRFLDFNRREAIPGREQSGTARNRFGVRVMLDGSHFSGQFAGTDHVDARMAFLASPGTTPQDTHGRETLQQGRPADEIGAVGTCHSSDGGDAMNHVERFRAVMDFQPVDRLPRWEWAMWWDETIEAASQFGEFLSRLRSCRPESFRPSGIMSREAALPSSC